MATHLEEFHQRMDKAIMPSREWTRQDAASLWNTPFLQWGDFFALKALKKKVATLEKEAFGVDDLKRFIKPYVRAVKKGHTRCLDYLYAMGDIVLQEAVQMHLENKYGKGSRHIDAFTEKEQALWDKVVKMRHRRKEAFLQKEVGRLFRRKYASRSSLQLQQFLEQVMETDDKIEFGLHKSQELKNQEMLNEKKRQYENTRFQRIPKIHLEKLKENSRK